MSLISNPANPVPADVVTGALKTPDGVSLRFARWAPPPGRKGTVCLFQGRSDFIEKYFETVRDLRARGFAVATLDWRGQGMSDRALPDRRKGYVRSFSEYQIDLDCFIREIVLPDCPSPIFALAHAMGGRCCYARLMQDFTRQHADRASAPAHRHQRSGEQVLHARQQ